MAGPYLTANSQFGLIVEATRGTLPASGTPYYIPVVSPQVTPMQKFLRDEALRGSANLVYDQIQAVRHDEVEFTSWLYGDTFPVYLRAILGGTDTTTGSGPYTHVIKLLNSPTTGSQPPSYSLFDFDGANYFTMSGTQMDSLNLSFGAEAAVEAKTKWMANPYVSYTAAPAPFTSVSYSAERAVPAWDTTVTINSTSFTNVVDGTIDINRKTQPIFTMGTQAPYANFAGPIEVSGKLTLVVATNADPFSTPTTSGYALTRSPQAMVVAFTDPNDQTSSTNHSVTLTMSAVQFQNVKRTRGKEYTEVEVEYTANGNSTDASSGYSPIQSSTVNGTSASY